MENTHKAILSTIDFNNVQRQLQMDTRTGNGKEKIYSLSGIVKCRDCGANMVRKTIPSGKKQFVYYVCGNHKANKNICSSHSIQAEALEESVRTLLNDQIKNVIHLESLYLCDWINEFKKYGYLKCLSREVVVSLIEQIFIYKKKEGEHYPRIKVYFNYTEASKLSSGYRKEFGYTKESQRIEESYLDADILTVDKKRDF